MTRFYLCVAVTVVVPAMAAWRHEHDDLVRAIVREIKAAFRAADLAQQEAAACLDVPGQPYAESQFSLDVRLARRERLLQELDALNRVPQKATHACDETQQSGSSAA
jgi:ABC-type nitrate/sulfonate/bicarbonate transport system substrate-binding protein